MHNFTCWIIYNGNLSGDKFYDQAFLVHQAALERGLRSSIVKNHEVIMSISNGNTLIEPLFGDPLPDFVVFFDKDISLARQFEKMNISTYNSSRALALCNNKATTLQMLSDCNVAIPETIIAPHLYSETSIADPRYHERVIATLGFPMIIKEVHGSFGLKVKLVHNEAEFHRAVSAIGNIPHLFQRFIKPSYGRDIRVHVIGDTAVAAMHRSSTSDFRANITNGGTMRSHNLTASQAALAVRCAKILEVDFAGVDLLFDERDEPIVGEVNGTAHIRNISTCTGVDIAGCMIEHILQKEASRHE